MRYEDANWQKAMRLKVDYNNMLEMCIRDRLYAHAIGAGLGGEIVLKIFFPRPSLPVDRGKNHGILSFNAV